jgi:enolase
VNCLGAPWSVLAAISAGGALGGLGRFGLATGALPWATFVITDLAIGTGGGQLKIGAPARGERVAKYNRLVEIDA